MDCPTNDDPNFSGRPRIKRTTGIPKSFLKTVQKPVAAEEDMEDTKQPLGVMVNAEGEWVVAEPDQATWDKFHTQAKPSDPSQLNGADSKSQANNKHLICPIDHQLFVDPMATPCCKMTYCKPCIQNLLLENNLQCPNCRTDDVLLDDLVPRSDLVSKVTDFEVSEVIRKSSQANDEQQDSKTPNESNGPTVSATKTAVTNTSDSGRPRTRISRKRPRAALAQ